MANYRRAHNRLRKKNQTKDIDRFPTDVFCFVLSATAEIVCPLGAGCVAARGLTIMRRVCRSQSG